MKSALFALASLVALAACGVDGPPEPPAGARPDLPAYQPLKR